MNQRPGGGKRSRHSEIDQGSSQPAWIREDLGSGLSSSRPEPVSYSEEGCQAGAQSRASAMWRWTGPSRGRVRSAAECSSLHPGEDSLSSRWTGVAGMQVVFKGMSKIKSPGRCLWKEMGCKGRAGGRPTFRG